MLERNAKVNFNKSGSGTITARVILPTSFIKEIELNENEKDIIISYDEKEKQIIIKKKENSRGN